MKPHLTSLFALVVTASALAACGDDPTDPSARTVDGLLISLSLSPSTIEQRGSLTAELTVTNTTREEVELVSMCTSLILVEAFRGGERVDLEGSANGCFGALTPFRIPAGGSLVKTREIRAAIPGEGPAPEGRYVLRVTFRVSDLPGVEESFIVR